MERWGQVPSQPSNYVSILHLRERWLKENEGNQEEKEDLKHLELHEQLQKVPRTKPEEKDFRKPVIRKPRINASSRNRNGNGKFEGCYRAVAGGNACNVNETCKKTEDESEPQVAVPRIERDENKKKKSKRKGRNKNPKLQKEEMHKPLPTPEENLKEDLREKECEVGVQNGKKNVWAGKMCEKKGTGSRRGPEKTGDTHEMKEVENKLSRVSVSFEIKRGRNNGVYRGSSHGNQNFRDHRYLDRWASHKQRGIGMIWVRKDELSKSA